MKKVILLLVFLLFSSAFLANYLTNITSYNFIFSSLIIIALLIGIVIFILCISSLYNYKRKFKTIIYNNFSSKNIQKQDYSSIST